jgi:hypothetical protein
MRPRVADLITVDRVERALDEALRELREFGPGATNLMAISSLEYRIGALRRRKSALEQRDSGRQR